MVNVLLVDVVGERDNKFDEEEEDGDVEIASPVVREMVVVGALGLICLAGELEEAIEFERDRFCRLPCARVGDPILA